MTTNNNNRASPAAELLKLSEAQVRKRAIEIVALPREHRECGFALAEQMYRAGFSQIGADQSDFETWLQAILVEIRQVVHDIDTRGGAKGGNA